MSLQKKEEQEPTIITSSLILNDVLYEEVYLNGQYLFCYNNKAMFKYVQKVFDKEITYLPQAGEEIQKEVVLLPSSPSTEILIETQTGNYSGFLEVLQEIKTFIHKYCDIQEKFEEIIPYWVLGTYVYDRLDQFPILSFQGDTGTGKTRCKDVIGSICHKPTRCNGGISAPAMYRLIDKWKGTLLLDEADFRNSDETAEIIKLLNCGFERRSPIAKCDMDNNFKLLFFNPYCPKIVTRRKEWYDKATESRCINIISQQTVRKDLPIVLPSTFEKEALNLRNKLLAFRLASWQNFKNSDVRPFEGLDIEPRLAQTCNSLAMVVLPFKEIFERFKLVVLEMQKDLIEERSGTVEGALVRAYYELKEEQGREVVTPTDMCLVASEFFGDEVKSRSAGKFLKSLGFVSKVKRSGKNTFKDVFLVPNLWDVLKKRYIVTCVTSKSLVTKQAQKQNKEETSYPPSLTVTDETNVTHVTTPILVITSFFEQNQSCSFETLKTECDKKSISEEELFRCLTHLLSTGQIFQPKPDHYEVLK